MLGEEVVNLQPLPEEHSVRLSSPVPSGEMLTVRRVDFAAIVGTAGGERLRVLVLVEVQKASFIDEVMQFRENPGRHYVDGDNYHEGADRKRRPRPLRAIYILSCRCRTSGTCWM